MLSMVSRKDRSFASDSGRKHFSRRGATWSNSDGGCAARKTLWAFLVNAAGSVTQLSLARAKRATKGWLSMPIDEAPIIWAAMQVVPEPTNGSNMLIEWGSSTDRMTSSTHVAEKPAEYRN